MVASEVSKGDLHPASARQNGPCRRYVVVPTGDREYRSLVVEA